MSFYQSRKASKPFAFDGDYRSASSSDQARNDGGLVSFFADEPAPTRSTEWSATPVTEEDLREGMDDYKPSEDSGEDLKDLIAGMPHNIAKNQGDHASKQ